jgi:hypothetical protein
MNGLGGSTFSDVNANGVNDRSYSKDVSGLSLSSTVYDIVFPSEK